MQSNSIPMQAREDETVSIRVYSKWTSTLI